MQYKRISADCHLDMIWLPPDLFTSQAPRDLKGRMPFVAEGPNGKEWIAKNGASFGLVGGVGSAGRRYEPGKQHRADRMAEAGLYDDGKKGIRRPGDPDLRAKELDRDGVDAEVIYGVLAAAAKLSDAEASAEMLRIYNDFIIDFSKHYPDRMIGLACLPFGDVEAAAKEVHRVAKMGVRALSCPAPGICSRCGTRAGTRCGRRSTRRSYRCTSIRSHRSTRSCALKSKVNRCWHCAIAAFAYFR
jgi:uncharacterized protein